MLRRTILRTIATGAGALALAGLGIAGPLPGNNSFHAGISAAVLAGHAAHTHISRTRAGNRHKPA